MDSEQMKFEKARSLAAPLLAPLFSSEVWEDYQKLIAMADFLCLLNLFSQNHCVPLSVTAFHPL